MNRSERLIGLQKLDLHGWKSIEHLEGFELGPMNVLIGANGSGKSNFISFFKLLNWMTPGNLQVYIGRSGGGNSVLHDGAAITPQMSATLTFESKEGINEFHMRLAHAHPDTLLFVDERFRFSRSTRPGQSKWIPLGAGHREAEIIGAAERGDTTARVTLRLLKECVVYQFHNTSDTARIRQRWPVDDNRMLKEDAMNLAAFLYRLRTSKLQYYQRIVETLRQIAPFFADFELEPAEGNIILQWRERGTDLVFGAHQASDGMLRIMALVTLLLQPEEDLPTMVILDEPELGLHPYAIHVLAGLLKSVSTRRRVILATQSMTLIDYFEPEEIVVVERHGRESLFRRLDSGKLKDWLEEYSIAELWEKNVIGGRPS